MMNFYNLNKKFKYEDASDLPDDAWSQLFVDGESKTDKEVLSGKYFLSYVNPTYGPWSTVIDMKNLKLSYTLPAIPFTEFYKGYSGDTSFEDVLDDTKVNLPDYVKKLVDVGSLVEGVVHCNEKVYFTNPRLRVESTDLEGGLYCANDTVSDDNVKTTLIEPGPAENNFIGLSKKDDNTLYACRYTNLKNDELSGAVVSIDLTTKNVTVLVDKNHLDEPLDQINDIHILEDGSFFFSEPETDRVYYSTAQNVVSLVYQGELNDGPNGIAYSKTLGKLWIALLNKAKCIVFDISINSGVVTLSNKKTEEEFSPNTGIGGDGLEYIEKFEYGDYFMNNVLIMCTNRTKYGLVIKFIDSNQVFYLNTPESCINVTYDKRILYVTTGQHVYRIDLDLALSVPNLEMQSSLLNSASELQVKIFATGLDKTRNLIVNKYNDVLAITSLLGVVLYRSEVDYKDDNFKALKQEDGIVLGCSPKEMAELEPDTEADAKINHGLCCRHYPEQNVTKIFVSSENSVYSYTYDDSTKENALKPLSEPKLIIKNYI